MHFDLFQQRTWMAANLEDLGLCPGSSSCEKKFKLWRQSEFDKAENVEILAVFLSIKRLKLKAQFYRQSLHFLILAEEQALYTVYR